MKNGTSWRPALAAGSGSPTEMSHCRTNPTASELVTGLSVDPCDVRKVDAMKPSGHVACENRPTAIDLFSGCGGLTLGLKLGGFNVIGAVDIDPLSIETYQANHKDVAVWAADIRDLEPAEMLSTLNLEPGELDLLAGCPPCQGFSTMRTLNGSLRVDDPRNDLLLEILRFVDALRPKAVMIENVPGLADDESFQVFFCRMHKAEYRGDQDVLNAAEYGVPQRRKRLIYVAGLRTEIPFAEPVNTTEQLPLHRRHKTRAGGVAIPKDTLHSSHGPGSQKGGEEPQTARKTTAGQRARPLHQMPARTRQAKQGPLRAVLQKDPRTPSRGKADAKQTRSAGE